jgi:hypothetical protein
MVHGERRHDEVEVALGQWALETAHAKIGGGYIAETASSISALSSMPTSSASEWTSEPVLS